jgi:predicted phosphodiesterase
MGFKLKRIFHVFLLIFILLISLNTITAQEKITFIAFGHIYPDYDALNLSLSLIEKENPDFVVFLGDSVLRGEEKYWELLFSITDKIKVPVYFVPGNHEIESQPEGQEYFKQNISKEFFFDFTIKNTTFVILNSVQEIYTGKTTHYDISEEQADFIGEIYERDNTNKFIFMHHCLFYNYDNQFCNSRDFYKENNWNEGAVPLIKNETIAVFVGDTGINEPYFGYIENDISYFGIGFSPEEAQLKVPQHMLKVVFENEELTVTPIPLRQDLTQVKYIQRIDKDFFPLFKTFIKKNLALVLKSFSLLILLLLGIIALLLRKIDKIKRHK